jgi:hypothetical protein
MVQWVQERVLAETVHPLRMLKNRRIYVCNYIIILYIYSEILCTTKKMTSIHLI